MTVATVLRTTENRAGTYLVMVRIPELKRDVMVTSPKDLPEGKHINITGAGARWELVKS